MNKPIVFHPFLFSEYFILFIAARNMEEVSLSQILLPSAFLLILTSLAVIVFRLFSMDRLKTGLLISIFWVLFFTYGHIFDLLSEWRTGSLVLAKHKYLLIIWAVTYLLLTYIVLKTKKKLIALTKITNIFAIVLVTFSLISIGVHLVKTNERGERIPVKQSEKEIARSGNVKLLPDIYYIILDAYARADVLNEFYGYDNNHFIDNLKNQGFYIATKSHSNYSTTFMSLASSMNMEYVNYLANFEKAGSSSRRAPFRMIQNSKAMNFLKNKGYAFITFSSGSGATENMSYADLQYGTGQIDEFIIVLIQSTALRPFSRFILSKNHRKRILYTFSQLADVHKIKKPKFVFAHILCPHPPYVFGKNGETVPVGELKFDGSHWLKKQLYLNQLIYINGKIEKLVNEIKKNSDISPIIILQGDHGSASSFFQHPGGYRQKNPDKTMLKERTSILNAYLLPNGGNRLLYDSITPVNTFRVVFKYYFNADMELLDDFVYFSGYYDDTFKFVDVTDTLKELDSRH